MKNVVEAINLVVNGVNLAFSRGAYNMKEVHDLHEAIEYIKQAVNTQQSPPVSNVEVIAPKDTTPKTSTYSAENKEDYS